MHFTRDDDEDDGTFSNLKLFLYSTLYGQRQRPVMAAYYPTDYITIVDTLILLY